jgi:Clostripain family
MASKTSRGGQRSRRVRNAPASKNVSVPAKKWTVMVYMAAGVNAQTEEAALRDIEELQKVGTTDSMNVLVEIDRRWPGFPQLYRIWKDRSEQLLDEDKPTGAIPHNNEARAEKNMSTGNPAPLREFLEFSRKYAPAERYLLVLWGHSFGLGFGRDHGDALTLKELADALSTFQQDGKLELLGANACAMSYAEAAFELQNSTKYLVASQISMPFPGWPYGEILKEIDRNPGADGQKLGETIAELFIKSLDEKNVSLTLLNLAHASELKEPLKQLADALGRSLRRKPRVDEIRGAFLDTAHGDVRPLIDLADLCQNLTGVSDQSVSDAASALSDLLDVHNKKFVLEHKKTGDLEGLNGVGIFAPAITSDRDQKRLDLSKKEYVKLALVSGKGNKWAHVVYDGLRKALEPLNEEVIEFVRSTGASTPGDRNGVTQLLLSLNRVFQKLEQALEKTKSDVDSALVGSATDSARVPPRPESLARLGAPYLRLGNGHRPYLSPAELGATALRAETPAATGGNGSKRALGTFDIVAQSLAGLEDALATVERTTRRVLTNSRLGLGDVEPDPKPSVVLGDVEPDPKPSVVLGDVEPDPKPSVVLGDGAANGGIGVPLPSGTRAAAELFSQAAASLSMLERALSHLESVVSAVLVDPANGWAVAKEDEFRDRIRRHVDQAFGEMREQVRASRVMLRHIVTDPGQGLGPGRQPGLLGDVRERLALAAGFSRRTLKLL